jgi:alkylation response protein AidB-like acyl-CoA dehydrogenase
LKGIERRSATDLGERWMRRGTVRYDGVRVPAAFRLGEEGLAFDYLKSEFTRERLLLAAVYLGVGRASFDDTVRYAGSRQAFGRPISRHEAVGFPLVEDWARLDAAWLYVARALERFDSGHDLSAEAALAKWLATETALTAIDHAIQFHGGEGYSNELPHEQRWRDVRSGAIAHGPSEIMHLVAVRELWPRSESPDRAGGERRAGARAPTRPS